MDVAGQKEGLVQYQVSHLMSNFQWAQSQPQLYGMVTAWGLLWACLVTGRLKHGWGVVGQSEQGLVKR